MSSKSAAQSIFKYVIWTGLGLIAVAMLGLFGEAAPAILVVAVASGIALLLLRSSTEEKDFITTLFLGALLVRLAFGVFVHLLELRTFFGGDAFTYDAKGYRIVEVWRGLVDADNSLYLRSTDSSQPGWGINYLVALIYALTGRNILAAQSFCAVVGAATAPMVYFCAHKIFGNIRVSKSAALSIAFFPTFIIWSSQLLKDGLIIFLLVLAMTMVLHLQERISYSALAALLLSLFGIITLRFYIFYMVATAVAGSFIVGVSGRSTSMVRRAAVLVLIGFGLTYIGAIREASVTFERYGDLDRLQNSRLDLAKSAESGYGEDTDVSTTEGAITAIPIGFLFLMLAPFPWQMTNLRQVITLPEMLAWWATIPLLISGIWYSIRNRLKSALPILFFSAMLMLAYSIFLGNVGTAYRQRAQIQVFLFIFIAVGLELRREHREDRRRERMLKQRRLDDHLRAGAQVHS